MNKLIARYFLIFIGAGALLFFLFRERIPFGKDNSSFSVDGDIVITRIDFFQGKNKLSLEKSGERWLINKKDEARKSAVIFIIRTLHEIQIKSPVSSEIFGRDIIEKNLDPVKVHIFSGRKLVKSFFVYKTSSNSYGNIMKIKPDSKPFIVYIPGYEENIGTHFIVNELFWKPYSVFSLLPSQIDRVKVEYPSDTSASFMIRNNKRIFSLSDLHNDISGWDTVKVKRYFTYYTSIPFETWAFDLTENEKKTIGSAQPMIKISVKPFQGEEIILTVWEKWNSADGVRTKDSDRVFAKTGERDEIFIMRYFDLDPILKKRSYFFTK
jgi:hypothetical protein